MMRRTDGRKDGRTEGMKLRYNKKWKSGEMFKESRDKKSASSNIWIKTGELS